MMSAGGKGVYLPKDLLHSKAFKAIKSAHTIRVLMEFYLRRRMSKPKSRDGKNSLPVIVNNGDIVLDYKYLMDHRGMSQTTISRCFTELVNLGFVDVAEIANGLHRQPTKWAISERWRKYGTPNFRATERPVITPPFARKRKSQLPHTEQNNG